MNKHVSNGFSCLPERMFHPHESRIFWQYLTDRHGIGEQSIPPLEDIVSERAIPCPWLLRSYVTKI